MSPVNIIGLIISGTLFLFMMLGLSGVLDKIFFGKWPNERRGKKPIKEEETIRYIGMGDVRLSKSARCAACDGLICEAGGYYFFEDTSWRVCIPCYSSRPMTVVAADIFQVTQDWRLHKYFCDCNGHPSKPKDERYAFKKATT
jgi:hypothetical protein